MNISKCNKCGKEFPIVLKEKEIDNMQVQYFMCTHCKCLYIVACIDGYIKNMKKKYKKLIKANKQNKVAKVLRDMKQYSDNKSKEIEVKLCINEHAQLINDISNKEKY